MDVNPRGWVGTLFLPLPAPPSPPSPAHRSQPNKAVLFHQSTHNPTKLNCSTSQLTTQQRSTSQLTTQQRLSCTIPPVNTVPYLSTHTAYRYKIHFFYSIIWGGYDHTAKWIQENLIFRRFCCCFKLAKRLKNCQMSS